MIGQGYEYHAAGKKGSHDPGVFDPDWNKLPTRIDRDRDPWPPPSPSDSPDSISIDRDKPDWPPPLPPARTGDDG